MRLLSNPGTSGAVGTRSPLNYLYLVPALALVGVLVYFSVAYTIWLSGYDWNGFGPDRIFVGFDNYLRIFTDPVFWKALTNVILFFILVFVTMGIGLWFAIALHSRVAGKVIYKVILFLPVVLAPAVMAPVFRQMFSVNGQVNELLSAVGLGALRHAWLADPATALYVLMLITIWGGTGFSFILYYAAITQIEPEIYEAARVDGATSIRQIVSITVPMLRRTHVTLIVLGTISVLKIFDVPQIITQGGPANATQFLGTYIYQQGVRNYEAGYAAAITVVLVLICVVLTSSQIRLSRSRGN